MDHKNLEAWKEATKFIESPSYGAMASTRVFLMVVNYNLHDQY